MHDGLRCALDGLEGAGNQVLAGLHQNLNGHVRRNVAVLDEGAHKVEVGLRGGGEAHLNLLVAHLDQQLEHGQLAVGVHGVNQRLVAVAQVHGAPARCLLHDLVRPGAVGKVDNNLLVEGTVLVYRHGAGLLVVFHDEFPVGWSVSCSPLRGLCCARVSVPEPSSSRRCIVSMLVRCRVKKPERSRQVLACPVPANKQQVYCGAVRAAHALTVSGHASTLSQPAKDYRRRGRARPSSGRTRGRRLRPHAVIRPGTRKGAHPPQWRMRPPFTHRRQPRRVSRRRRRSGTCSGRRSGRSRYPRWPPPASPSLHLRGSRYQSSPTRPEPLRLPPRG